MLPKPVQMYVVALLFSGGYTVRRRRTCDAVVAGLAGAGGFKQTPLLTEKAC